MHTEMTTYCTVATTAN